MRDSFTLPIDVIEGEVQEFPKEMSFFLNEALPIGPTTIRYFDLEMNQYAHKTFYIQSGQMLFGTSLFQTVQDYWDYVYGTECCILINGCPILLNSKQLVA